EKVCSVSFPLFFESLLIHFLFKFRGTRDDDSFPTGRRGSPGKFFIGGLPRETTRVQFFKLCHKYGEIKDSVIMLDPRTGIPRGFGFVTYENPSVIDKVIEDTHVINGKQVVIKRTKPKGVVGTKDFKTRRTFISGIPSRLTEDEFKDFLERSRSTESCEIIMRFGFITFGTEQSVDDLLAKGNKVELDGGLQVVLDLICKEAVDSHTLGPIIKECRSLLEQIPNHRFCQINRDSNCCADHLARMGATMTKDFVIFEFPPDCIKLLLFAESLEPEDNDFLEHFGKYGEIVDSVIMKKKETGQRRGFGFVTYADPSIVDKTRKIFVGGIPSGVSKDEFKDFFSQFGEVNEHQIIQDHATGGSCGFGYITFDTEQVVDDLLAKGNKVELAGAQVEIKRVSELHGDSRNAYDEFDNIGYRSGGSGPHCGAAGHTGYDGAEFGEYGGYGSGMELYREEPSLEYSGHYGGGEFGHYGEYGSGTEPYRGEPSLIYSADLEGGEFGGLKCYGGLMEPHRDEPFLEYLGHSGEGEFGRYGEYGSGMELYRGEPSLQYSGHHGGGEFGQFKYQGGVMEPYTEEPSLEYSNHCGRDEFGSGMVPYRGEPFKYWRHVEGGQFGGYGGAKELCRKEPFDEHSILSRGGFNKGYDVGHGFGGPSDIYGEYGAGGIGRGYRGGGEGAFFGHRGGHGSVERGAWYHPYAR
ncbi:RNA recognition motif domain - like 10, partial [Theobroma cacao]